MANIYLEKVANALTRAISKGLVNSVSHVARDGSKMGASALNKALTGATTTGVVHTPGTRKIVVNGIKGIRESVNPARAVTTTDALSKSTIQQRLASRKAATASGRVFEKPTKTVFGTEIKGSTKSVAGSSSNTFLDKAKSFIEANPKSSLAAGVVGAGALGHSVGKRKSENSYSGTY